jgi:NAD(P)-dependent dehydrogenase (short-subunit alcohol dehydrogenase family)
VVLGLAPVVSHYDVRGKVALITGGARGIGFAAAGALARRGAVPVIVDLDEDAVDRAAAQFAEASGFAGDVTDRGAMQRIVAGASERHGSVDIVIANAGIASRGATVRAMSGEAFDRVLAVNLGGVYNTVIAALPQIAARQGHVVLTSSIYAFWNGVGAAPYAVAKAGVEQFGRALRVELVPHGASASIAYFGFIDTEMVRRAIDGDPLAGRIEALWPAALRKRLSPAQAGEAIARGIERRTARIVAPKRWAPLSALRGITGPLLDKQMERDADTQAIVRELDARGSEEQPLTA